MLPVFLEQRVDRFYRERIERHGGRNVFNGRYPGPASILLNSNDYLSLACHPDILAAQAERLLLAGSGPQMSAVFLHENDGPYRRLQNRLARFAGMEAAVLSQSGYAANVGLLQSLAGRQCPVYLDRFAHMSLWEGAHSAGAQARMFHHNDPASLEGRIRRFGPGVVAVDAIYSTLGDACPLVELVEICERTGSILVVDESHSLGLYGPGGAGLVAELGLSGRVAFLTASLAKAFASRAGVVFGSARFMSYFPWEARPAIFSTMLEPHDIARIDRTLDVIRDEEWRRSRVHALASDIRTHMVVEGYASAALSRSPILALLAGSEESTVALRNRLEEHDIFAAVFVSPTTPPDRTLLRVTIHAGLSDTEVARVKDALCAIRDDVRPDSWPDPFGK